MAGYFLDSAIGNRSKKLCCEWLEQEFNNHSDIDFLAMHDIVKTDVSRSNKICIIGGFTSNDPIPELYDPTCKGERLFDMLRNFCTRYELVIFLNCKIISYNLNIDNLYFINDNEHVLGLFFDKNHNIEKNGYIRPSALDIKKNLMYLSGRSSFFRLAKFFHILQKKHNAYLTYNGAIPDIKNNIDNQVYISELKKHYDLVLNDTKKDISFDDFIDLVPYCNFEDNTHFLNDFQKLNLPSEPVDHSLFCLIDETFDAYTTEKTAIPFAFLKVGIFDCYKLPDFLKNLGFDIFDDIIDHNYQYIEHRPIRQAEIYKQVDKVCNLSIEECCDLYESIQHRLLANQKHLYDILPDKHYKQQQKIFNDVKKLIREQL